MTEENPDMLFDPTMKKKKKKKINLEDLDAMTENSSNTETKTEDTSSVNTVKENKVEDDLDFSAMKKKKKKKKPLDLEGEEADGEKAKSEKISAPADDIDLDEDFSKMKKKKKKKKNALDLNELADSLPADGDEVDGQAKDKQETNEDDNREYTYEELLKRVFDIMRAKNPAMVEGGKRKFVMKPPQVVRVGTKKTSFVNFTEICKILHRQPKHLLAFLMAELGTSGTVDGTNQLIIKGKFQQKHIENVLKRYIKEYVTCHTCRSPETILHKETRLFFLQCETCGSKCSVQSIKSGFQAVTTKRAQLKNKQQ